MASTNNKTRAYAKATSLAQRTTPLSHRTMPYDERRVPEEEPPHDPETARYPPSSRHTSFHDAQEDNAIHSQQHWEDQSSQGGEDAEESWAPFNPAPLATSCGEPTPTATNTPSVLIDRVAEACAFGQAALDHNASRASSKSASVSSGAHTARQEATSTALDETQQSMATMMAMLRSVQAQLDGLKVEVNTKNAQLAEQQQQLDQQ
jgi:hypothetical protein